MLTFGLRAQRFRHASQAIRMVEEAHHFVGVNDRDEDTAVSRMVDSAIFPFILKRMPDLLAS